MENEQAILNIPIGTKEQEITKLNPAKVKIVKVNMEYIEKVKGHKAIFEVNHPDSPDKNINISAVSFLDGKAVKTVGTWIKQDEDGNLQKGTGLTTFMTRIGANTLQECHGKEIDTEFNEAGYLVFKAY